MKFDGVHIISLLVGVAVGFFLLPMLFRRSAG